MRIHCREFATKSRSTWSSRPMAISTIPDLTTAVCLYRVVQEALRNVAKHADARQVRVRVRRVEEEVQLAVADDGKGFDLAKVREQGGSLGLRSIEERVRLVGGRLAIRTAPQEGTTITVWVKDSRRTRSRVCRCLAPYAAPPF